MTSKRLIFLIALIFAYAASRGQDIKTLIDSLKYLQTDTLDCSADIYWKIIGQKEKAIPYLIDQLTDTTPTHIKYGCKKTPLNISEVAYFALTEIADFPIFAVTGYQFDYLDANGCTGFHHWYFFTDTMGFKPEFQKSVRNWWAKNRKKYKWKQTPRKYLTVCEIKYGATGHFYYR